MRNKIDENFINNYCIENNITLVRISYKDIKNKEYINILEKSLNLL